VPWEIFKQVNTSEGNIQKSSALIKYVFKPCLSPKEPQRLDKTNEQIYKNVCMTIMWKYLPIISWNLEKDANKLNLNSSHTNLVLE